MWHERLGVALTATLMSLAAFGPARSVTTSEDALVAALLAIEYVDKERPC